MPSLFMDIVTGLPLLLFASVSGFVVAAMIPWLHRILGEWLTIAAAILPVGLTVGFMMAAPGVIGGTPIMETTRWLPGLDLTLAFHLDGLALLFALLITGIGAMIVLYIHGYLHGHEHKHRFVMFTLMFMSSMLGVVLSGNVILLFIFWELTSFTSYLLIGFNHEQEASRKAALQALLVTGLGGLFLLAGLILAGHTAGTMEISGIIANRDAVTADPLFPYILGCILVGAFTKSAQVPFHFWLPNAMHAPTPASAYLHSSTMVKAGVYVLARFHPAFGHTVGWELVVTGFGAATLITGALMAIGQVYLKRLLAYTTVSALGAMVMLLGIGTDAAIKSAAVFLLAHACYKAALFLIAGIIDHETGEKNVTRLGGLFRAMPLTGIAAIVATVSMAGVPPAFGFIGKETAYTALLTEHPLVVAIFLVSGACFMLVGWQTGVKPFIGSVRETPRQPHEAPVTMLIGPLLLGLITLTLGLMPGFADELIASKASAIRGSSIDLHLKLWHGINTELMLSAATLAAGVVMIASAGFWLKCGQRMSFVTRYGPDQMYQRALNALVWIAAWQTRVLQNGSLRSYLQITVLSMGAVVIMSFVHGKVPLLFDGYSPVDSRMAVLCILIIAAAIAATLSNSRLGAVAAMGVVGFSVAIFFVFFGAPDLAMTQLVVETLSVVLLVAAFYYLPPFTKRSTWQGKTRDIIVSVFTGAVVTLLVLLAVRVQLRPTISTYSAETSVPIAHGRNIVNVILVDYRGLDTLGEITVLAVAGLGSLALLKLRLHKGGKS